MTKTLKIISFDTELGPKGISGFKQADHQLLDTRWDGRPTQEPIHFILGIDHSKLFFGGRRSRKPNCETGLSPGAFQEGLWRADCLEAFISFDSNREHYLEINLSPAGLWWGQFFSSYRTTAEGMNLSKLEVNVETELNEQAWSTYMSLDLKSLAKILKTNRLDKQIFETNSAANICATLLDESKNLSYLSFFKNHNIKADFHLESLRRKLNIQNQAKNL